MSKVQVASCKYKSYHLAFMPRRVPKVAVFPGQFDPITNGHLDVISRAGRLFDELIVAVGINPEKSELFPHAERVALARAVLKNVPGVRVEKYTGLTVDFVKRCRARAIIRGIRDVSDLHHEFSLALANRAVGGVETVFIMTGDQYALTSSSLIRQVASLGGDMRQLRGVLPDLVIERLLAIRHRIERPRTDSDTRGA
jgi:pantetheine-phosphate adenylyltransferase